MLATHDVFLPKLLGKFFVCGRITWGREKEYFEAYRRELLERPGVKFFFFLRSDFIEKYGSSDTATCVVEKIFVEIMPIDVLI